MRWKRSIWHHAQVLGQRRQILKLVLVAGSHHHLITHVHHLMPGVIVQVFVTAKAAFSWYVSHLSIHKSWVHSRKRQVAIYLSLQPTVLHIRLHIMHARWMKLHVHCCSSSRTHRMRHLRCLVFVELPVMKKGNVFFSPNIKLTVDNIMPAQIKFGHHCNLFFA